MQVKIIPVHPKSERVVPKYINDRIPVKVGAKVSSKIVSLAPILSSAIK